MGAPAEDAEAKSEAGLEGWPGRCGGEDKLAAGVWEREHVGENEDLKAGSRSWASTG